MSITTSAGDGVRVTSSAKDNGTLSSDAVLPDNQFVVPDGIGATNNGNLESSPTMDGRLITIRRNEAIEETRYITVEDGLTTGTVNDDWDSPPTGGMAYDISYIIEDAVTVTGFSLISKRTRDYSLGRLFSVGNDTTGTFAWFALLDGASIESDNTITPPDSTFEIDGDGRWDFGYEHGGAAVPGGYLILTANVDADPGFRVRPGGQFRSYDAFFTSVENNITEILDASRPIIKGLKIYKALYQSIWEGEGLMEDLVLQGVNNVNDRLEIDESYDVDGILLINTNGFYPDNLTTGTVLNYQSIGNLQDIEFLREGTLVDFINPIWDGGEPAINWAGISTGSVQERYDYIIKTVTPAAVALTNSKVYVWDNSDADISFQEFQVETGITNASGVFETTLLQRGWHDDPPGGSGTVHGVFDQRILRYGQFPFEASFSLGQQFGIIDQDITLIDDAGVELSEAAADAVTGTYVIEYTGNPATLLAYDAGGSIFSDGEIVTGTTSLAVGTVVEVIGDTTSGHLYMNTRNAADFVDDESLAGNSGGAATADAATFNSDYTWEVGGGGSVGTTLSDLYSWLSSKSAKLNLEFSWILEMLRHRVQLVLRSGDNYSTEEADSEGAFITNRGAGTVTGMTADDGSVFTPPTTVTLTLSNLVAGSEVRIYDDVGGGEAGDELAGTESSGVSFPYTYTYSGSDVPVVIVIMHIDYEYIRILIDLTSSDSTLPINQAGDRVYNNP